MREVSVTWSTMVNTLANRSSGIVWTLEDISRFISTCSGWGDDGREFDDLCSA